MDSIIDYTLFFDKRKFKFTGTEQELEAEIENIKYYLYCDLTSSILVDFKKYADGVLKLCYTTKVHPIEPRCSFNKKKHQWEDVTSIALSQIRSSMDYCPVCKLVKITDHEEDTITYKGGV